LQFDAAACLVLASVANWPQGKDSFIPGIALEWPLDLGVLIARQLAVFICSSDCRGPWLWRGLGAGEFSAGADRDCEIIAP
jgi:hypothetical protein